MTTTQPEPAAGNLELLAAVYVKMLATCDQVPTHVLAGAHAALPDSHDEAALTALIGHPGTTAAQARRLIEHAGPPTRKSPRVGASYLRRPDISDAKTADLAATMMDGLDLHHRDQLNELAELAATVPTRTAQLALLRCYPEPDVYLAVAGNDRADLATRISVLSAACERDLTADQRATMRRLPADLRARALDLTSSWLSIAALLREPLTAEQTAAGLRNLLRAAARDATTGPAKQAHTLSTAVFAAVAHHQPGQFADLTQTVVTATVPWTAADRVALTLALTDPADPIPHRLAPVRWSMLLQAAGTAPAVWEKLKVWLSDLLSSPEAATVVAALTAEADPTVADLHAAVAGITAAAA